MFNAFDGLFMVFFFLFMMDIATLLEYAALLRLH